MPNRWKWLAPALLIALLFEPAITAVKHAVDPPLAEDMRPVVVLLKDRLQPGDGIFVFHRGRPAFTYYARRFNLDTSAAVFGNRGDGEAFIRAQIAPLLGRARVWVVRTTRDELAERDMLAVLAEFAPPRESFVARNARAELYGFRRN